MDKDKIQVLEELLLEEDGLLVSLRLGDGLRQDKIEGICSILKELAIEWSENECIPKRAVDLFVDFYPAIESSNGLYDGEEESRIMDAADKIMNLIRDCIRYN